LNQLNINIDSLNQLNVTADSSCSEKFTNIKEMYFLSQSVYFTMSQKISVETDVTEDLSTTEDVNKNLNTITEQ